MGVQRMLSAVEIVDDYFDQVAMIEYERVCVCTVDLAVGGPFATTREGSRQGWYFWSDERESIPSCTRQGPSVRVFGLVTTRKLTGFDLQ